jgi:hypothetical protein
MNAFKNCSSRHRHPGWNGFDPAERIQLTPGLGALRQF